MGFPETLSSACRVRGVAPAGSAMRVTTPLTLVEVVELPLPELVDEPLPLLLLPDEVGVGAGVPLPDGIGDGVGVPLLDGVGEGVGVPLAVGLGVGEVALTVVSAL